MPFNVRIYTRSLKNVKGFFFVMATVFGLNFFFVSPAYAYVDPGSGSVIVTTILGLIAALGYWFRKAIYRILDLFGGRKNRQNERGPNDRV